MYGYAEMRRFLKMMKKSEAIANHQMFVKKISLGTNNSSNTMSQVADFSKRYMKPYVKTRKN